MQSEGMECSQPIKQFRRLLYSISLDDGLESRREPHIVAQRIRIPSLVGIFVWTVAVQVRVTSFFGVWRWHLARGGLPCHQRWCVRPGRSHRSERRTQYNQVQVRLGSRSVLPNRISRSWAEMRFEQHMLRS
jgi:hypothetical protein